MGFASYSVSNRSLRASANDYATASTSQIFSQQTERRAHESMLPQKALLRECRDSETHPETLPIVLALDVTGSMGAVPEFLVREGLPKIVGKLMEKGLRDPSILFLAVGDHTYDGYPLQVGQFESGDEELDMWLTRTYLEGGGGGNEGESYLLALDFCGNRVVTDSFEKRNKKGVLIIFGDEPCLKYVPESAMREIYGDNYKGGDITFEKALMDAQEKFEVFFICPNNHWKADECEKALQPVLKERFLKAEKQSDIADLVVKIVLDVANSNKRTTKQGVEKKEVETEKPNILL